LDHTKSLGDTLEKIAYEKAGILKEKTPLVLGKLPANAEAVIAEIAGKKNVPILKFAQDFKIENVTFTVDGTKFDYRFENYHWKNLSINLLGKHQASNAAVALTAFLTFMKKIEKKIDEQNIRKALNEINWMGRMQIIRRCPTVILDGAHNEEGVRALKNNLLAMFPNQKIYFVLAILRDKNLSSIIKDICQVSYKVFISKNHSQRAAEIEEQLDIARKHHRNIEVIHDVVAATEAAVNEASEKDIVMISGSLYTISEVLKKKKLF
jgi:dihydrofolate synthase/folylpolyglutamate synthase